jgi:exodeoxyribonuclease VII small subunit
MERKKQGKRTGDKGDPGDFEGSLKELEKIAELLESGDMSLDESIRQFERGMRLARFCRKKLDEAEKRIEILQKTGGGHVVSKEVTVDEETGELRDDDLQGSLL